MTDIEASKARIQQQSGLLTKKLLDVLGEHFNSSAEGFCPEVVLSSLGSSMVELFAHLQRAGAPPWLLAGLAQAADSYLMLVSEQIAAIAAGKRPTVSGVTVTVRRPASPAPEAGRA